MNLSRLVVGLLLLMGAVALGACGAEVADEDEDGIADEETELSSQEHQGCNAKEKAAATKTCAKKGVKHCHSNGPGKAPSVTCNGKAPAVLVHGEKKP